MPVAQPISSVYAEDGFTAYILRITSYRRHFYSKADRHFQCRFLFNASFLRIGYTLSMASPDTPNDRFQFSGFGASPDVKDEDGVFLLVISHEGSLTAAAYADDRFLRAQEFLSAEGGIMEIIPSPIYGA